MGEFNEDVLNYASTQFGTPVDDKPAEAAMADVTTDTATDPPAAMADDLTNQEAPVEQSTEAQPAASPEPTPVVPDYNTILDEISGGAFKDVESFKSALPKISEYDTLKAAKEELEAKVNIKPFANEYVEKLNELIKSGAGEDQIKNFQKISQVDFDKLSPIDAKVANMVKDGYSEAIARKIVEQEYPIEDFEEGSDERLILEEKLRISSKADFEALQSYKAEMSKVEVDTSAQELAETKRLAELAQTEQHKQLVNQAVPKIAETFTGLGELNLSGNVKEGEEPMKLGFDFAPEFKAEIPQMLTNYFLDGKTEMTNETVAEAYGYIRAEYLNKNIESIAQSIAKHVESVTWEKAVNKYENRSGLPQQQENVNTDNTQAEYSSFLQKVANGK